MKRGVVLILTIAGALLIAGHASAQDAKPAPKPDRTPIKAIYIPLADHYAGIVAYERYRDEMAHANYTIERMKSWPLLRAYFMSGEVDLAFIICPQAMDMFREKPNFRWVSLMQRDGNALAINDLLNAEVNLPRDRAHRKPDRRVADALAAAKKRLGRPTECGVPHLQSTHTVILYKYLKDHGRTLGLGTGNDETVVAVGVPPPKSPAFIKKNNSRGIAASFEQSLPWADVVETRGSGHVAWYSKDVLPWPHGHVDCIAIATDACIKTKTEALREVISSIHKAGLDIENARRAGGQAMTDISNLIRKHIPEHNAEAIVQSLRPDLNVINYTHLNIDKDGLERIMELAVEGGILQAPISIEAFADTRFATTITETELQAGIAAPVGVTTVLTERTRAALDAKIRLMKGYALHPLVVNAVKAQNTEAMPLNKIKAIDAAWIAGEKEDLVESLQGNSVATFLRKELLAKDPAHTEFFLCDRQGAVVAEYPKTSDYWQGDEEKFTSCFNEGNGITFVGPPEFDESTSTYAVQLSIPVNDGEKTIGVLILGLANIK